MSANEKQPLLPSANSSGDPKSTQHLPLPQTARPVHSSTELYGYSLMALSCVGFSGMSFLVHVAEEQYRFAPLSAVYVRALVQTALSVAYMLTFLDIRQVLSRLTRHQVKLLTFRGFSGAIGIACVFKALQLLPVGDAVTIFFCGPVFTMLLSNLVLAEPITPLDGVAAVVSFLGILLISRPGVDVAGVSSADRIAGSLFAFVAAFLSSVAYTAIRSLGTSIHFMTSVFSLGLSSLIISVMLGGAVGPAYFVSMKDGTVLVLISALFAFAGQCCLTKGLQHCRAGPGVLIRNLDVPLAYVLGLLFLGEAPSWLSFGGACMVLSSALLLGMRQIMKA